MSCYKFTDSDILQELGSPLAFRQSDHFELVLVHPLKQFDLVRQGVLQSFCQCFDQILDVTF